MAEPVASQFILFAYTILTGIIAGLLYDLYAGISYVFRFKNRIVVHVGDVLYWLALTAVVYSLLWYYNQGEVRFFVLLGLGIGALLYHRFCRRRARKVIIGCLEQAFCFLKWAARVLIWLLGILFFPFRMLYLALTWPFRLLGAALGKAGGGLAVLFKKIVPVPVKNFYRRVQFRWQQIKAALKRKK